jgi:ABC-2 type transport system ATP-binding protein
MADAKIDHAILTVRRLTKHYPGFHLNVPALCVYPDNIVALVGPNGAGKTTLVRTILGIVNADSGKVSYLGKDVDPQSAEIRIRTGYVPEEPVLYEGVKVESLIAFVRRLYPCWDDALCEGLMRDFGLDRTKRIRALSKGMRTKLLVILALSHKPEMLILDEPTSGMDVTSREDFWAFMCDLISKRQVKSILLSSHQLDDVERICDRIVFIRNGRILFDEPKDIFLRDWKKVSFKATQEIAAISDCIKINSELQNGDNTVLLTPWSDRKRTVLISAGVQDLTVSPLTLKEVYSAIVRGEGCFRTRIENSWHPGKTRTE